MFFHHTEKLFFVLLARACVFQGNQFLLAQDDEDECKAETKEFTFDSKVFEDDVFFDDLEVHQQFKITVMCTCEGKPKNMGTVGPTTIKNTFDESKTDGPFINTLGEGEGLQVDWVGGAVASDVRSLALIGTGGAVGGGVGFCIAGPPGAGIGSVCGLVAGTCSAAICELLDDEVMWNYRRSVKFSCELKDNLWEVIMEEDPKPVQTGATEFKTNDDEFYREYTSEDPKQISTKVCAKGDPHFTSWDGKRFDFHGECDLVLATSRNFGGGKGLDVHIRTAMVSRTNHPYSYISEAAVRVGQDILAVDRNGYWLNGVRHPFEDEDAIGSLSGFNVKVSDSATKRGKFMKKFKVDLTEGHFVTIKAANSHIDVSIDTGLTGHFDDLVGLLGRHHDRAWVDRHGNSMKDAHENAFGQMWQVREWEDMLFPNAVGPQHPVKCNVPDPETQTARHLRNLEDIEKMEKAKIACEHVLHPSDRDNCIFDVLATGDFGMADFYDEF